MPEVVEFFVKRDVAIRENMVGDDYLVHLLERVDADELRCCTIEIQFFLHFTQCALFWRFSTFQKPRDESVKRSEGLRPPAIVREHHHSVVLDNRRDNRRRIVVVNEPAVRCADTAYFTLHRAVGKRRGTEGTEVEFGHAGLPGAQ